MAHESLNDCNELFVWNMLAKFKLCNTLLFFLSGSSHRTAQGIEYIAIELR